jgi:hypothetical protein
MVLIESALVTILLCVCTVTTITDFKSGLISNKHLLMAAGPALVLNSIYYYAYSSIFLKAFALNLLVMFLITILFYAFHIWSAGDSKLLLLVIFCLPGRIFFEGQQALAPTLQIIILVFSIAFIYLICESIVMGIKRRDLLQINFSQLNMGLLAKQYLKCTIYIFLMNAIFMVPYFADFYRNNSSLIMVLNLLIILTVLSVELFSNSYILISSCIVVFCVAYWQGVSIFGGSQLEIYLLALGIILLRMIAEKYNYQVIPVGNLKKGMVLAWSSIAFFKPSRVKGLPEETTEDIRSRLTQGEVENIKRWKESKYGKDEIVVIAKIPFAIFITLGSVVFMAIRFIWTP